MIDALFWYTGLLAWILIVFGVVSTIVIEGAASVFIDAKARQLCG